MPHHHLFLHNHYKNYRMLCGPSRLIWFGIGSIATYAWMRHHHDRDRDRDHGHPGSFWPPRFEHQHRARAQWERDDAPPLPPPAPPAGAPPPPSPDHAEWRRTREWRFTQQGHQGQGGAPDPSSTHVAPPSGPWQREPAPQQQELVTERDYERLRQMGRSAEETISGMSEATIDNMMSGLQRLKERLAERRGQQMQETGSQQANSTPAASPEEPPRHWV